MCDRPFGQKLVTEPLCLERFHKHFKKQEMCLVFITNPARRLARAVAASSEVFAAVRITRCREGGVKPGATISPPSRTVVRFEVFTAVTMKNGVVWDVTSCGTCKNRGFGGTYRLLHQGDKNR
jgi:hypothetical protein